MKKNMLVKYFGALIALLLSAEQSMAADTGKFYIGADVGSTEFSGDGPAEGVVYLSGQKFKDSVSSYGAHAGFQFNEWFAIELGYTNFSSATTDFKFNPDVAFIVTPNHIQTIDAEGLSLAGAFSYGISTDFTVFGVLGIAAMEYENTLSGGFSPVTGSLLVKNSLSEHGLVYGLGATYALTHSFNLRADLRRNDVGNFALDTASIGIEYSF